MDRQRLCYNLVSTSYVFVWVKFKSIYKSVARPGGLKQTIRHIWWENHKMLRRNLPTVNWNSEMCTMFNLASLSENELSNLI